MRVQDPYHEGELLVQERLNEREIGKHNGRAISDSIMQGALKYIDPDFPDDHEAMRHEMRQRGM